MNATSLIWIRPLLVCATMILVATVEAAPADFEAFFGEYEGQAITNQGDIRKRDLRVKILPHESGFTVSWISVTRKSNGKLKRKEYSINFHPTRRSNIYRSGERTDFFGNAVPLDPMEGDPYVWARIHEETLTIYALHVLEDGGYEMQTYERRRIPGGLDLKYSRVRDGEILRTVSGTLAEVE